MSCVRFLLIIMAVSIAIVENKKSVARFLTSNIERIRGIDPEWQKEIETAIYDIIQLYSM